MAKSTRFYCLSSCKSISFIKLIDKQPQRMRNYVLQVVEAGK